ncbi:aldo/keto reductase [Streptomyces sp. NRRL B-24085]|uniref:aldo/keto reductase n=1 Tax=Streptomyces sp. NRRL B-24085 TaxID=1709476 RepID=UPI001F2E665C|nr:aldo/keto reductase [Streptomyces sp. NRRL B-24085]
MLTGKCSREERSPAAGCVAGGTASSRKSLNISLGWVTDRNLAMAEAVKEVTLELGRTPAQVAPAWTLNAPGVTAPIISARTIAQLEGDLGASWPAATRSAPSTSAIRWACSPAITSARSPQGT